MHLEQTLYVCVHGRINYNLIAGCFGLVGLCQLCTISLYSVNVFEGETSCNQLLLILQCTCMYTLKISLLLINNTEMNIYILFSMHACTYLHITNRNASHKR